MAGGCCCWCCWCWCSDIDIFCVYHINNMKWKLAVGTNYCISCCCARQESSGRDAASQSWRGVHSIGSSSSFPTAHPCCLFHALSCFLPLEIEDLPVHRQAQGLELPQIPSKSGNHLGTSFNQFTPNYLKLPNQFFQSLPFYTSLFCFGTASPCLPIFHLRAYSSVSWRHRANSPVHADLISLISIQACIHIASTHAMCTCTLRMLKDAQATYLTRNHMIGLPPYDRGLEGYTILSIVQGKS